MVIKHLVISGGGPTGFLVYGIASQLAKKEFWQVADLKSIYGCSIGAYMGVVFSLGYEWTWLDDYFIKRPWEKLMAMSTTHLIDIYEKKCLINEHFFTEALTPLLRGKDLANTITLSQLYAYNKIEIHMYATNINSKQLEKVDISYKTHPDLSVIKALRMTMAVPLLFQPIYEGEGCYVDGGLLNNFPLNDCIHQQQCETDEILSFKNIRETNEININEKSSIFDFLLILLKKTHASIDTEGAQLEIKNNVRCMVDDISSFDKWAKMLQSEDMRREVIERGYKQAELFLAKLLVDALD